MTDKKKKKEVSNPNELKLGNGHTIFLAAPDADEWEEKDEWCEHGRITGFDFKKGFPGHNDKTICFPLFRVVFNFSAGI